MVVGGRSVGRRAVTRLLPRARGVMTCVIRIRRGLRLFTRSRGRGGGLRAESVQQRVCRGSCGGRLRSGILWAGRGGDVLGLLRDGHLIS